MTFAPVQPGVARRAPRIGEIRTRYRILRLPSSGGESEISLFMGDAIELAIMFADVVGSTRLYEVMGDVKARDLVATCLDVMRDATEGHSGTVIKTIGDEVMSTFPTVDDALDAAVQMQEM